MTDEPARNADRVALHLLREALDLDTDVERERLLATRCTDDPALLERVRAMLQRIGADDEREPAEENADSLLDSSLGPYRVVERIGRGGMGVVYRGEREGADFRQDVALKLIRRGFDFDDIRARFLRERRILARLSHPNLARFVDGGVAPDGRPWFALEFVRGEPVTRWCDLHSLDPRARVKLFLDVCAAVQYAHAQLVVHRDLKPGNVLVDADGRVRLLDFGIARLLGDEDAGAAPTAAGSRGVLTPEYAAPEQFGGETAGVATDVYALGVVLYELVAGALPYALDRNDLAAAERVIREQPPQPLPQAIARDGAEATARRLAARSTNLRSYRNEVRGDLSRILDKALAKEPERRYASVQGFADDLARWLTGAPVRVSGNAVGYRLRKFVGRNRLAVGLAAVAVIVAAAGVAGVALKSIEAQREAENARRAAARAKAEAQVASGVSEFLSGVFGKAAPFNTGGKTLSLTEALDLARQEAMTVYKDQPETRIPILLAVGSTYESMYMKPEARATLAEALTEAKALDPPKPVLLARTMSAFSELELENDLAHSLDLAQGAVRILDATPEATDDERVHALAKLAVVLFAKRDFPPALEATQRRLALFERRGALEDAGYYEALSDKAMILAELKRHDESIALHRRLVALRTRQAGREDHLDVSYERANLARALMVAGHNKESIEEMRKAIAVEKPFYGGNFRIASITTVLAQALAKDGQYDEAEKELLWALGIVEKDPELRLRAIKMRVALAGLRADAGRCDAAREALDSIARDFDVESIGDDEKARIDEAKAKVGACAGANPAR